MGITTPALAAALEADCTGIGFVEIFNAGDATAALDGAYAKLYNLEVKAERLELELATRRDIGRLRAASQELALGAPSEVVVVPALEGGVAR